MKKKSVQKVTNIYDKKAGKHLQASIPRMPNLTKPSSVWGINVVLFKGIMEHI